MVVTSQLHSFRLYQDTGSKNLGANTYNTGDEWASTGIRAVTYIPIPGVAGWNLIGGYEESFQHLPLPLHLQDLL